MRRVQQSARHCPRSDIRFVSPSGTIRARFVAQEFKAGEQSVDLFVVAGTAVTSWIVDVVAARMC